MKVVLDDVCVDVVAETFAHKRVPIQVIPHNLQQHLVRRPSQKCPFFSHLYSKCMLQALVSYRRFLHVSSDWSSATLSGEANSVHGLAMDAHAEMVSSCFPLLFVSPPVPTLVTPLLLSLSLKPHARFSRRLLCQQSMAILSAHHTYPQALPPVLSTKWFRFHMTGVVGGCKRLSESRKPVTCTNQQP